MASTLCQKDLLVKLIARKASLALFESWDAIPSDMNKTPTQLPIHTLFKN